MSASAANPRAVRTPPLTAHSRPDTMPASGDPRYVVSLNPDHDLPVGLRLPPERTPEEVQAAGDTAERVVPVASRLVSLVRDDGHVYEITALLRALKGVELEALAVTLAAMVDPDRTVPDLLSWVTFDEHGNPVAPPVAAQTEPGPGDQWTRPCGTHAAYNRHKLRGEHPCPACFEAERAYRRERKRAQRATRA